ncbi:MAG TPA: UvrD-helicase domain-containing protein, partial [Polyangiaceae bacterium]|nr:UvrD-helicase domain-containing protein [Polyangiaceae bacterium]
MTELNEPQTEAVLHEQGPLLVFAGAGSGKTRTIVFRIANLIAEHRVPPYRILAVTFTNKAAGEMRERLEQLVGGEIARDLWVGTFHSVCARLLRRYHAEVGLVREFVIYDEADQKAMMTRILRETGINDREYPPKYVLSRIHAAKRDALGPAEVGLSHGFDVTLLDLYRAYQRAFTSAGAVDFEDLLLHVMRIAEDPASNAGEELRRRFRYVLVDEFQDTNAVQYRLVSALARESQNLCVVGDDDQSIYRWRGADVRIIRGFQRDFPNALVVKLEQNYRSTANVVAAALGVIEPSPVREPKRLWTAADAGDPVRIRTVRDEREEATYVARSVRAELDRGTRASEIAIFYRIHAQSRVIEEAFRAANLPYQIIGGMKFFERAEVKDLLAYLRLIENPRSDADLMRIINVPARGIGNKTQELLLSVASENTLSAFQALGPILESDRVASAAKGKLERFRTLIERFREQAQRLSVHELASLVVDETGYRQALHDADSAQADARLENVAELLGSIAEYENEAHLLGEQPSLQAYLERVSLVAAIDAAKDMPAVNMMTVHSAKGLEFTTVFLTGMEEEIFPYRAMESDELEDLDEERRLAYVAITRARKRLHIIHASVRTLFGRTRYQVPSRFLQDIPREVAVREGSGWAPSAPSGRPAPIRRER